MDDKEYYTMMNRSNSELIIKNIVKKAQTKKKVMEPININITEGRQGREDTEMLHEKKEN